MNYNPNIFRTYDIRGLVDIDFNRHWVHVLGQTMGTHIQAQGLTRCVVGYDCRHSSLSYHAALTQGLLSTGVDVISLGMVATPMFYYAVKTLNCHAGIMITASHNPAAYNGFKIWVGETTIHSQQLMALRQLLNDGLANPNIFKQGKGLASEYNIFPDYAQDICQRLTLARPLKVVLDGGNGAGGEYCTQVLRQLGAEVTPLYCKPDGNFPNHHPDPVVEANMQDLIHKVTFLQADLGLGLDGDADRLGVVDETGRLMFGDEVLSIYARELLQRQPGATIIGDVKCSDRLFTDIDAQGGQGLMWATGHSLIKSKMLELGAPLAGEMSGHMFFSDNWYNFDDAIYGAARLLSILSRTPEALSKQLLWPKAYSTPEINIPCPEEHKTTVIAAVRNHFKPLYTTLELDGARIKFHQGWGLVRASNTQPVLVTRYEAQTKAELDKIQAEVSGVVKHILKSL